MENNKKENIRVNLNIDPEVNPKLYAFLEKKDKRKRASIIRRMLEEMLQEEK
jgi:metal-responsive CopG/Arc/MetJ family transcriptional regulator|tara:strand:- start:115264 stop:115419 length:156 start_codon:yes stop_codon:yes gene_type:complete